MADKQPPPLMGATAIRPPERVGAEKYTYLLYDPKNGTILTRTPKSWGLIILFYCIYYSCLAAFWLACMKIFLTIQIQDPSALDTAKPTWTEGQSIIGVRPGIGIRPVQTYEEVDSGIFDLDWVSIPGSDDTAQQNLDEEYKKFKEEHGIEDKDNKWMMENMLMSKDYAGSKGYAYRAFQFFKVYRDNVANNNGEEFDSCAADTEGYRKDLKSFCRFKQSSLGSCQSFPYGYSKDAFNPCIFVKMNFGDDEVMTREEKQQFVDIFDAHGTPCYWRKGDVSVVCNFRMAHGRPGFSLEDGEKRELGVVLGETFRRVGDLSDKW